MTEQLEDFKVRMNNIVNDLMSITKSGKNRLEILNRPKPDPYNPENDPHIQRVKEIISKAISLNISKVVQSKI